MNFDDKPGAGLEADSPQDNPFIPPVGDYKSRVDKRDRQKPLGEIAKRQAKLDAEYDAYLARRVTRDGIGSRTIEWTPTLFNRNEKFRRKSRRIIVAALAGATETEIQMLEAFVGHAAAKRLREQGILPDGLTDHYKHPLRAGGEADPANLCIMISDMRRKLKVERIIPAFEQAYTNRTTGVKLTIQQLEAQAADCMAGSGSRELPKEMIRRVRMPFSHGVIELTQDDIDMRDIMGAETRAIEARKRMLSGRERPTHRPVHRPAHASGQQARGPRR